MTRKSYALLRKIGLTLLGIFIIISAVLNLTIGKMSYSNYWGGQVFTPFAIICGIIIICVVWLKRE